MEQLPGVIVIAKESPRELRLPIVTVKNNGRVEVFHLFHLVDGMKELAEELQDALDISGWERASHVDMCSNPLKNGQGASHQLVLVFQVGEGTLLQGLPLEEKLGCGHCRPTPRRLEDFEGPEQVPKMYRPLL